MKARWARQVGVGLGMALATWVALAVVLYLLHPRKIEAIYQGLARSVLQVECGRPVADELIYTLAPGVCRFANPEFDTRVIVDDDGFRNAAEHVGSGAIKVAVLGDSHAMGWGVAQGEKLSSLLARAPLFSVRDLSMSSYGTPRELIALTRYAPDADVIVLQYCTNDEAENAAFLADPAAFAAGAAARAASYATDVAKMREHARSSWLLAPLRTGFSALAATWRLMLLPPRGPRESPANIIAGEARLFAGVLTHFKSALAGKTVIVFESFPRSPRAGFAPAFRAALEVAGFDNVDVLDLAGTIGPRDYFHIDDHLRASGHVKLASRLLAEIDRLMQQPGRRR